MARVASSLLRGAGRLPDGELARSTPREPSVLELIERLCQTLRDERVAYCHWKSTEALGASASGENDLDLLVRRSDIGRFLNVLDRLGFKEARLPPPRDIPGVSHHYGLDVPSARFVHVHWQSQLILGDDTTKNHRIPMEDAYLASVVQGPLFAVPSPEAELAVFILRMVLKHATWDAIASGRGKLGASERRELSWLRERADKAGVLRLVRDHVPGVSEPLWENCSYALDHYASVWHRVRTARRLVSTLAPHTRHAPVHDTCLRLWRRASWGTRRHILRKRTRKVLVGGGAVIGIVGGDGAGKSSAVRGLNEALSPAFVTTQLHLGKPRRSVTTLAVKGPMYVARRFGLFSSTFAPAWEMEEAFEEPSVAWLLWHTLNARDRYREYTRARRLASAGSLVICDRFPLPELTLMDGARTRSLTDRHQLSRRVRFLRDLELRSYDRMAYPDVLIVLRLDPALAVSRRLDEDEEFVRRRNDEVWQRDWSDTPAVVIDASQRQDAVLREMLAQVWDRL